MIKVLIAEDSPLIAAIMRDMLNQDPEITVVGWARNGKEAIEMRESLQPNVITMDINMPVLSGLQAIEQIASAAPLPILVVSRLIESRDSELAFEALRCGAIDIMAQPSGQGFAVFQKIKEELLSRVKTVARIRPMRHFKRTQTNLPKAASGLRREPAPEPGEKSQARPGYGIVAIGASTGGPPALAVLLKGLPESFPSPIAVVQHIAPGFIKGLVHWLRRECPLAIKLAHHGETLNASTVYLAPDECHLEIGADQNIVLSDGPAVRGHRPSVDRLMESVSRSFGKRAVGVILTGMGSDGAQGLKKIREAGGKTIVQDEATSLVYGMPREAALCGAAELVRPLDKIAEELVEATSKAKGD